MLQRIRFHIENGRGEKTAIIYDSPITGTKYKLSYKELKRKVSIFAGALKNQGVSKGDRVIIYMPMIPQAVVAMLLVEELELFTLWYLVVLLQMS